MASFNILIIESNDWDRGQLLQHVRSLSHPVRVLGRADLDSARHQPDIVVLGISDDVSLETSRSAILRAREIAPHTQLILCAPRGLPELDRHVLELGARAFVLKPVDEMTLRRLLEETLTAIGLRSEREAYQRATRTSTRLAEIIGESEPIREVFSLLEKVAESPTTSVLLLGESGVGKSLFAQMVHDMCERERGPFIEINCATLPQQLLESELFGYEPGAFTDARAQKIGLIELANGGTLFLDEITEVDPVTQAKLLKVLDTRRFRRLGGERELEVDVRVIAASNRDILREVRAGRFREDLYYRLNVVQVTIPPLRERPGDIDRIAAWYLDHFRKKFGKTSVEFSAGAPVPG
jgi:transcriptional regulator with PAS, ATPase and Fis domain